MATVSSAHVNGTSSSLTSTFGAPQSSFNAFSSSLSFPHFNLHGTFDLSQYSLTPSLPSAASKPRKQVVLTLPMDILQGVKCSKQTTASSATASAADTMTTPNSTLSREIQVGSLLASSALSPVPLQLEQQHERSSKQTAFVPLSKKPSKKSLLQKWEKEKRTKIPAVHKVIKPSFVAGRRTVNVVNKPLLTSTSEPLKQTPTPSSEAPHPQQQQQQQQKESLDKLDILLRAADSLFKASENAFQPLPTTHPLSSGPSKTDKHRQTGKPRRASETFGAEDRSINKRRRSLPSPSSSSSTQPTRPHHTRHRDHRAEFEYY